MNNVEKLQKIKEYIENMSKNQQIEIFKMLTINSTKMSENNNGTFINLTELSSEIIEKLENYIEFVNTQHNNLVTLECEKQTIKKTFFDKKSEIKTINSNILANDLS